MAYVYPFLNGVDPYLSGYKNADNKFKSVCVVYTPFRIPSTLSSTMLMDKLYTDANYTEPFTLTEAVEMIQNGVPVIAYIDGQPYYADNVHMAYTISSGKQTISYIALRFNVVQKLPDSEAPLKVLVPFYGKLDITKETENDNLSYGSRDGDGHEEGKTGVNCNPFTIAFGLNTAGQKVIPNPFVET